jgi:hypothetical protein
MNTKASDRPGLNPWPVAITAFFAVAILGCGTFVAYCNRHPADLIAADYYEQEMRYQGQIERIQRAQQRAQLASITYDAASRHILIALPHQTHANTVGTIQLYRPSALNLDRQLKLEPAANGTQTIDAGGLLPGLWKVRVSWTSGNQDYFIDRQVVIGGKT